MMALYHGSVVRRRVRNAAVLVQLVVALIPVTIVKGLLARFVLTTIIVTDGYTRSRFVLIALASWHWFGMLLVMGAVIGAFG
jgi:hypothetical protein